MLDYGETDAHTKACGLGSSNNTCGLLFFCEVSLGLGALSHQRQNAPLSSFLSSASANIVG
jgi:hypothetical protein